MTPGFIAPFLTLMNNLVRHQNESSTNDCASVKFLLLPPFSETPNLLSPPALSTCALASEHCWRMSHSCVDSCHSLYSISPQLGPMSPSIPHIDSDQLFLLFYFTTPPQFPQELYPMLSLLGEKKVTASCVTPSGSCTPLHNLSSSVPNCPPSTR